MAKKLNFKRILEFSFLGSNKPKCLILAARGGYARNCVDIIPTFRKVYKSDIILSYNAVRNTTLS